ncbi:hypothetical protein A2797_01565 [candidate division WWE3 bacterium RIFCSPHIGHO2_01_FULL_48_15]|uniref:DUF1684 domain-containing protein n=1 Tax=candidate division WWE3 bacterium RIFCSPHIGHO2_01_FULL_48_15 TaxID=1802619 RepID=A0A1F4VBE3_UNCKA|nr:MAG: hypothetical protein A2797_01565 [candidate division WWE3 bacterium RIFCSPHIGHO2_01_FULL_48_15]
MEGIAEFREKKDEFFRNGHESPIPPSQRASFAGLKYFPENPATRFVSDLEKVPEEDVSFTTSTGETKVYKKIGRLKFEVEGQSAQLTLFQADSGSYFLPFRDATSVQETYGAGRYVEVKEVAPSTSSGLPTGGKKFEIDFNYAYNPYCAYNEGYSCPLPPPENWLKVPIKAGEMKLHD